MKTSKTPDKLAKNASKLHKKVGEILTSSPMFSNYEVRQEYRVSAVNPEFDSNREKFDWAVLGAKIVVECHGQQHYSPVRFGGISEDQAKRNLTELQEKDRIKRQAAQEAGWAYVVVRYDEEDLDEESLLERIREALVEPVIKKSLKRIKSMFKSVPAKIPKPKKYNWPKGQKIPSRPFPKRKKDADTSN